jgi:hypothetical protein
VQPVRDALDHYRRLNEAAKDERLHRKSVVEVGEGVGDGTSGTVVKSASAHSVKSRRSLGASSRSRSADEDEDMTAPGVRMNLYQSVGYLMNAACLPEGTGIYERPLSGQPEPGYYSNHSPGTEHCS